MCAASVPPEARFCPDCGVVTTLTGYGAPPQPVTPPASAPLYTPPPSSYAPPAPTPMPAPAAAPTPAWRLPSLSGIGAYLTVKYAAYTTVALFGAAAAVMLFAGLLFDERSPDTSLGLLGLSGLLVVFGYLALGVYGIAALFAVGLLHGNVAKLGIEPRFSLAGTLLLCLVPFVNFIGLPIVLQSLWRDSDPSLPAGAPVSARQGMLAPVWWGLAATASVLPVMLLSLAAPEAPALVLLVSAVVLAVVGVTPLCYSTAFDRVVGRQRARHANVITALGW